MCEIIRKCHRGCILKFAFVFYYFNLIINHCYKKCVHLYIYIKADSEFYINKKEFLCFALLNTHTVIFAKM